MKIKGIINFLLIAAGACLLASGNSLLKNEYAMSIGIILLMLGIYRASRGWNSERPEEG
ncbi:hypothetical protein [Zeaxanthinibacter enoshimensis]|uniref:Uncharacterized protein n=1 Tax=Zeaxanthinibacter enoshimensis TaxID=392009 RepID=A0A4V3D3E6_9FLAO|nr:hypothetical protein [Zeaxanthinibacter enoshimensis]TDQ29294.1 hypothetical protein CLV82_2749 [Zeaxanthinibacter enoshimensis]